MNYATQFKNLVKKTAWKNMAALPDFSHCDIEAECWTAMAIAIQSWDGSKGKLSSWIYTAVTGRMRDLRKRPFFQRPIYLGHLDVPDMGGGVMEMLLEEMDQAIHLIDDQDPYDFADINHQN